MQPQLKSVIANPKRDFHGTILPVCGREIVGVELNTVSVRLLTNVKDVPHETLDDGSALGLFKAVPKRRSCLAMMPAVKQPFDPPPAAQLSEIQWANRRELPPIIQKSKAMMLGAKTRRLNSNPFSTLKQPGVGRSFDEVVPIVSLNVINRNSVH
jgi:hypothetical protein